MLDTRTRGDIPDKKLSIVMVLYSRMTLLDLIGPAQPRRSTWVRRIRQVQRWSRLRSGYLTPLPNVRR
jgi:hypothetical protein